MSTFSKLSILALLLIGIAGNVVQYDSGENKPLINPHSCKWELCPYQNQERPVNEWETGTDSYILDSLHLSHPTFEYDELEEILDNIQSITI